MRQQPLMTPEAIKWLKEHDYPRTQNWLRMMVHNKKIYCINRHGRNFFTVSELKKVVKEKRKLKVTIS